MEQKKNTNYMFVYKNKLLSIFFSPDSSAPARVKSRGVGRKSAHIYSKHKHAKSEDKPLQIQL